MKLIDIWKKQIEDKSANIVIQDDFKRLVSRTGTSRYLHVFRYFQAAV
jgi:hypothetical protein